MKRSRVLGAALAAAVMMLGLAPSSGEAGIVRWRDGSPRTPLRAAARGSVRAVGVAGCNHGTRCRRTQSGRFVPRKHRRIIAGETAKFLDTPEIARAANADGYGDGSGDGDGDGEE